MSEVSRADPALTPDENSSSSEPNSIPPTTSEEATTNIGTAKASSATNIVNAEASSNISDTELAKTSGQEAKIGDAEVGKSPAVVVRPKFQKKVELTEEQKLRELYMQSFVYRHFGDSSSCFWLYRRRRVFTHGLNLLFLILDIVDMVVDIIVADGAPPEHPTWKATLWLACAQGLVCLLGAFYGFFSSICSRKRDISTFFSIEASIVWRTMVKIIPVSTEDFLATYAIIGINDLQGKTKLDLVSALSVGLAGLKCISIGCAAGCLVYRSQIRKGCYSLITFGLVVLESLTGFGMGGLLIYLAFAGNIEGSYRFVFLVATVVGWISAFAMIYTSVMFMMAFTASTKMLAKKVVPFRNPWFWLFLLVPGLCVPLIEKYSPEDLLSKKRAKAPANSEF